jgi:hypothetical protein
MLRYFGGRMFEIDYFRIVGAILLYAGRLAWLQMLELGTIPRRQWRRSGPSRRPWR